MSGYFGDPAKQATGQKARQLRQQAQAAGVPTPEVSAKHIGRKAVGMEPQKVRRAQAKGAISRKKGNV